MAVVSVQQLQVAINATIAEISLNNDLRYGVQYYLNGKAATASLTNDTAVNAIKAVVPGANLLLNAAVARANR
mgnify:CR=1 FL=1